MGVRPWKSDEWEVVPKHVSIIVGVDRRREVYRIIIADSKGSKFNFGQRITTPVDRTLIASAPRLYEDFI